ncbi:hypothetical protein SMICM304S_07946 [Streptomyces microflavus]
MAETSDPAGTLVVGDAELAAGLGADVVPDLDALVKRLDARADHRRLLFALPDRASGQWHDAERSAAEALRTLQVCLGDARLQSAELVWITRDAVSSSPGDQVENWAHAAVWGMVRTAGTEQPERVLRLIDLDPGAPDFRLLARVIETGGEPECVLRGETAHVPRARPTVEEVDALVLPDEGSWHLHQREDDQLDVIAATHDEGAPEPVAPGEVRIEVRAAGVSPGHAQVLEFAGIVMEVAAASPPYTRATRSWAVRQPRSATRSVWTLPPSGRCPRTSPSRRRPLTRPPPMRGRTRGPSPPSTYATRRTPCATRSRTPRTRLGIRPC